MGARLLPDLNALAIQLVEDHPGHRYVADQLVPALAGEDTLLSFGYLPMRTQWLLEEFGVERVDARNAVSSLVDRPIEWCHVDGETITRAYRLSAEKNHDAFDCFYLAVALDAEADAIVTTDRDFATLCRDEPVEYRNPVPEEVLEQFENHP